MGLFALPEVDPGVSKPDIREIVFFVGAEILLSFQIEPVSDPDEECILKVFQLGINRVVGDIDMLF